MQITFLKLIIYRQIDNPISVFWDLICLKILLMESKWKLVNLASLQHIDPSFNGTDLPSFKTVHSESGKT
jgi:hypothetical protein